MHPDRTTTYAATRTRTLAHTLPFYCHPTYRGRAHTANCQGEKRPLHHAAMNGAPEEVMKLLLEANNDAVTKADKACGLVHLSRSPHAQH